MRIRQAGVVGYDDGFYWTENYPSDGDIDGDNDGGMIPTPNYLVDLSKVASNALGKQASMMATYKIHSVTIGIRPVDDATDNAEGAVFAGNHYYVLATEHGKTALQLARRTEKEIEKSEFDGDSFFLSTDKDYRGFRYNWYPGNEHRVIDFGTTCGLPNLDNTWNLREISVYYDQMTQPDESNALFNGRAPGIMSTMWSCGWNTKPFGAMGAGLGDCHSELHLDIFPLLAGAVRYSHANEPGVVDDDWHVEIEVDFTVGGTF